VILQLQSGGGVAAGQPSVARPGAALAAAKKKLEPVLAPSADTLGATTNLRSVPGLSSSAGNTVGQANRGTPHFTAVPLTAENAVEIWNHALAKLSGMVVDQAMHFDSVAIPAPNRLVIRFKREYAVCKSACERPEQVARFEQALAEVTGQRVRVEFALAAEEPDPSATPATLARAISPHQRMLEMMQHPLIQRATELFGAEVKDVIPPQE
jgi:hypothetical protein